MSVIGYSEAGSNAQVAAVSAVANAATPSLNPTAVKVAAYTAVANDQVLVDTTLLTVPVTLPTAPPDKTRIGIKSVAGSVLNGLLARSVTIVAGAGDHFNTATGSTTLAINSLRAGFTVQYVAATHVWVATPFADPNQIQAASDARYGARFPKASNQVLLGLDGGPIQTQTTVDQRKLANPTNGNVVPVSNDSNFTEQWDVLEFEDGCTIHVGRYVPGTPVVLSAPLSTGAPITTLPVNATPAIIYPGLIRVAFTDGSQVLHYQTFTATGTTAAGSTSITITSATPTYAFPTNSSVKYAGSDTQGQGVLAIRTSVDKITMAPAAASAPTVLHVDSSSNPSVRDCRGTNLTRLSDGRILLTWALTSITVATDHTLTQGPGGLFGNTRAMIGTYTPSNTAGQFGTLVWGSEFVVPTGYTVADLWGHCAAVEPTANPGTVLFPVYGSNTTTSLDNTWSVGYVVGTYTPGAGGGFTFPNAAIIVADNTKTGMTASKPGEPSIIDCPNGDYVFVWRDNNSTGGQWQARNVGGASVFTNASGWVCETTMRWSTIASQPSMVKFKNGRIAFVSRLVNVTNLTTGALLVYSDDNCNTWTNAVPDGGLPTQFIEQRLGIGGWTYGHIKESVTKPGHYLFTYSTTLGSQAFPSSGYGATITVLRILTDGAGVTDHGFGYFSGLYSSDEPVGSNVGFLHKGPDGDALHSKGAVVAETANAWTAPGMLRNVGDLDWTGKRGYGAGASPDYRVFVDRANGWGVGDAYVPRRPSEIDLPLADFPGVLWQTFDRALATGEVQLVGGTMMLSGMVPVLNQAATKMRVWSGAVAGAGITHAWAGICVVNAATGVPSVSLISSDTGAALSGKSGAYSAGTWPAESDVVFTIPSNKQTANSYRFAFIVVVATTPPSLAARPTRAGTGIHFSHPILSGPSTTGITTVAPSGAQTAPAAAAAGAFYAQFEA